jgi:hypothetical protein
MVRANEFMHMKQKFMNTYAIGYRRQIERSEIAAK